MSKRDGMQSPDDPKRLDDGSKPMRRVVELARRVLRERGLTDEQIEALLKRPKAPDHLN